MADYCPYCGEEMDMPGHAIYPDPEFDHEAVVCPVLAELAPYGEVLLADVHPGLLLRVTGRLPRAAQEGEARDG